MAMATIELEANSLDALVKATLEIRPAGETPALLWYRGANCGKYQLLPKLMRDGQPIDRVFEREARLITRFRQRSMPYWPAGYPQNDWEHLFAMQHHGLPTRLLDWTENLFVAAYFAVSSQARHESGKGHEGTCEPAIWVLDPVRWNKAMPGLSEFSETIQVLTTADDHLDPYNPTTNRKRPKSPVTIYGTHNSARIVAQRGTFIVWGAEVRPLDEYQQGDIWKIRLTGDRESLFRDLQTLGFTETLVFPELTFLAQELSRAEGWR
jgi:hypothetical protein